MSVTTRRRSPSFSPACGHFAERLRARGVAVRYVGYEDPDNAGSIAGELLRALGGGDLPAGRDHRARRVAPARRARGLRPHGAGAGRDPRRRPLHLLARAIPALGRGSPRPAHGVLLPRDAEADRPSHGRRGAGRRALELRRREPEAPARGRDAAAAPLRRAGRSSRAAPSPTSPGSSPIISARSTISASPPRPRQPRRSCPISWETSCPASAATRTPWRAASRGCGMR